MKQIFLNILLILTFTAAASQEPNDLAVEFYLDSLFDAEEIDVPLATSQFFSYAKKNYKGVDNIKEFVEYSAFKMKCKEKQYTKNFTKECRELHSFAIVAHRHLIELENRLYSIILAGKPDKSEEFIHTLFITLHEMNYWELNCYKPKELGSSLLKLYSLTENTDLAEKLCFLIIAAKIYKASYYVNPMHICVSTAAKIEIVMDLDSLNLNTENITIDSLPTGTKPPLFVGGFSNLNTYVANNLKYPEKAIAYGLFGRVIVSFKVNESGEHYDIKIKKSPSELLSKEVIRVVQSFPKWLPDSQTIIGSGFTKFTMPVDFVLPEE